jgi:hypothetical protein
METFAVFTTTTTTTTYLHVCHKNNNKSMRNTKLVRTVIKQIRLPDLDISV